MSFFESLNESAYLVEVRLSELLSEKRGAERLNKAVRYSALGGGKRLRAYLALCFCALCGEAPEKALDYGCAIEMIHAFSLIHDDLHAMDNDDMRRGKPSNHKAFGEATAILAGDSLALDAFSVVGKNRLCTPEQNLTAVLLLSEKSGRFGMCAGQQYDIDGEGMVFTLMREYKNLYVDISAGSGYIALNINLSYTQKFLNEFSDRVLYGSDICYHDDVIKQSFFMNKLLDENYITEEVYDKIARENAFKLLKNA